MLKNFQLGTAYTVLLIVLQITMASKKAHTNILKWPQINANTWEVCMVGRGRTKTKCPQQRGVIWQTDPIGKVCGSLIFRTS